MPPLSIQSIYNAILAGRRDFRNQTPWLHAPISKDEWLDKTFSQHQLELQTYYWSGWHIKDNHK